MSQTLLIVDDHDNVRSALRDWLVEVYPQFRVIEAGCVEEAIPLIQADPPLLVVMDITLPGMTGIEGTRQIKAVWPSTQIVMLTIHDDAIYRDDAMSAGANAYVSKQKAQTELIPTINRVLTNAVNHQTVDSL